MSGFLNALTDPGVDALAGMAQGFAQAAMPSRMPIPFGAALGMGAAGGLRGAAQGQQLQQAAQNVQHAQMANELMKSAMPMQIAKNQMLANIWKNPGLLASLGGGGSPFGAPAASSSSAPGADAGTMGGASGSYASAAPVPVTQGATTAPDYSKANAAALASISDPNMRKMVTNTIMQSGLSPAQVAPWISTLHNEGPVSADTPDGKSGEIGPGQVMPATGATMGFTPEQLRNPQTNLLASAKYFKTQWAAGGNTPNAAFAGYNTGSPTASDPGYVSEGASRLAGWGYPGATEGANPGAPSGPISPSFALARSQQLMQQADQLQRQQQIARFWQGQGIPVMPPAGDPAALRTAAQQFRELAIAGPKAAAQADAQARAAWQRPIVTRAGVYDPRSGQEVYRQPEYHEVQDPKTGVEYPAFIQPMPNGQLSVQGGPPGMNGKLPPVQIGPGQEENIKELAQEYATTDRKQYEGAQQSLLQLDQQDHNIATLNQNGGWSVTGAGNQTRLEWAKGINSAFQAMGIKPLFDPSKVGSWEDAEKLETQLAFAQAKQLGSREAMQIVQMSRAATPGAENTPQGYQAVSAGVREMNTREIDLYNFRTAWFDHNGGNLLGADTAFNTKFPATMYADRAISTLHPYKITATDQAGAMKQMDQYLPGTFVTLPNGKITMVPPRSGAPPIPPEYMRYVQGASAGVR